MPGVPAPLDDGCLQYLDNIVEEDLYLPRSSAHVDRHFSLTDFTLGPDFSGHLQSTTSQVSSAESSSRTHFSGDSGYHSITSHQCPDCGRVLSSKSSLRRHALSKTACPSGVTRLDNLPKRQIKPKSRSRFVRKSSPGFYFEPIEEQPALEEGTTDTSTFEKSTFHEKLPEEKKSQVFNLQALHPNKQVGGTRTLKEPKSKIWNQSKDTADIFPASASKTYPIENNSLTLPPIGKWDLNDSSHTGLSAAVSYTSPQPLTCSMSLPPIVDFAGLSKGPISKTLIRPDCGLVDIPASKCKVSTKASQMLVPIHCADVSHDEEGDNENEDRVTLLAEWLNNTRAPCTTFSEAKSETPTSTLGSEYEGFDTDSDTHAFTEYSDHLPEWDATGTVVIPMKREFMRRILWSFENARLDSLPWYLGGQRDASSPAVNQTYASGSETPSSGKRSAGTSSDVGGGSRPAKRAKRCVSGREADHSGENDGNDTQSSTSSTNQGFPAPPTFACPFVKRYPGRYKECYGHVLKDVSRVKQHLKVHKSHQLPIYCPRCSQIFAVERHRDNHLREGTCPTSPEPKWEGITAEQRSQLSKRTRYANTSPKSWFEVWEILFPGTPPPSTPYVDMSLAEELRVFREHMLSEGPAIWDDILQSRLPDHLAQHSEDIRLFQETAFPDLIAEICTRWSARTAESPSSPPRASFSRQRRSDLHSPSVSDSALGTSISGSSHAGHDPSQGDPRLTLPLPTPPIQPPSESLHPVTSLQDVYIPVGEDMYGSQLLRNQRTGVTVTVYAPTDDLDIFDEVDATAGE
jgi:hypothetical protein